MQTNLSYVDFVGGAGTESNYSVLLATVKLDAPIEVRTSRTQNYSVRIELGENCGDYQTLIDSFNGPNGTVTSPPVTIPAGIHRLRITAWDYDGANGNFNFQTNGAGGGFVTGTDGILLSSAVPSERCFEGKVCDGSTDVIEVATGKVVPGATKCEEDSELPTDWELVSDRCYLTEIDPEGPFTREVTISNLGVDRGPLFPAAGSNNMPWNNGPVFQMNGQDGLPIYDEYELVSFSVLGDVGTISTQPTQIRSNSATLTGNLVGPVVVGTDQLIQFNFDPGQILTNAGTDGVGNLPIRLDPTLGGGQMAYTTQPIPAGNQMTFGGGTAGQEIMGSLTIRLRERSQVRVLGFLNPETGEIRCYRYDELTKSSMPQGAIPGEWDECPDETPVIEVASTLCFDVDDPDNPGTPIKAFKNVMSDGAYGPLTLLRDICPEAL